jgi:hypothetical protein
MVPRALALTVMLLLSASVASAAKRQLTMREAHAVVARDLKRHFHALVRVEVWGCKRHTPRAVGCFTEFHRHRPAAVCVAHYEVLRRSRGVVVAFRGLRSLFGSHCERASGGVKPHYHLAPKIH